MLRRERGSVSRPSGLRPGAAPPDAFHRRSYMSARTFLRALGAVPMLTTMLFSLVHAGWYDTGIPVCAPLDPKTFMRVAPDGAGGVLFTMMHRTGTGLPDGDPYAHR